MRRLCIGGDKARLNVKVQKGFIYCNAQGACLVGGRGIKVARGVLNVRSDNNASSLGQVL